MERPILNGVAARRSRYLRLVAACLVAGLAAALTSGAARAPEVVHTRLESSVPADGDTLARMPGTVELRFSGPVNPALSAFIVVTAEGDSLRLEMESGPDGDRVLQGTAPDLPPGRYRALWRTVSADGHPVSGEIGFVLSSASPAGGELGVDTVSGDREPNPEGSDPAARAESPRASPPDRGVSAAEASQTGTEGPSTGVVIVAGLAAFSLLGFAGLLWHCGSLPLMDEPRVGRTVRVFAGLALGFGFVDLASWTLRVVPDGAGLPAYAAALGSATGIVGSASLALIAVAMALLSRRPRTAAGVALAAVLIGAAAGHPAVFSPWLTIPANALHLGAATIWLGGLLLLASIPDRPAIAAAGWTLPETVRSVSASALLAVVLIAASGMIQSVRFVGEVGALTSTAYGRGVLAKSAGLLVLMGFGAFHRLRVLPRLETDGGRRLRRTVLVEMIVMLVVVLVAVWLARVPPPIEH